MIETEALIVAYAMSRLGCAFRGRLERAAEARSGDGAAAGPEGAADGGGGVGGAGEGGKSGVIIGGYTLKH